MVSPEINKIKESCVSTYTTKNNDTDSYLESSSVVLYDNYYSFKNYICSSTELCTNIHYSLLKEYFDKWIEILFKPDYLKFIYYLKKNKMCHLRGFVKVFHDDAGNTTKKMNNLLRYGIIEQTDKEKYESILYKHRKVFNIDDWHFNKTDVYQLTELGIKFYGSLDFTKSLHPLIIQQIHNYARELSKTNERIKMEIRNSKQFIESILPHYKDLIKNQRPLASGQKPMNFESWIEGKIETLFNKTGVVIDKTPDEILMELNKRIKDDGGNNF